MTDLSDIAGDDPRRLRSLRDNLRQLANGPHPELREMARAVLDEEITLRTAVLSSTYNDALNAAFDRFWTYYDQLSPEERSELETGGYDVGDDAHRRFAD